MQIIVEKAKMDEERKKAPVSCTLVEHRGPNVRFFDEDDLEETRLVLPEYSRMLLPIGFPPDMKGAFGVTAKGCTLSYQVEAAPLAAPPLSF